VLFRINMDETLKNKIGVEMPRYTTLGACNPKFAYQALQAEDRIGLMLPCNIIVRELPDGKTEVSAIHALQSMLAVDKDKVKEVAAAAAVRGPEAPRRDSASGQVLEHARPAALLPVRVGRRPDPDNGGPCFQVIDVPMWPGAGSEVMLQAGGQPPGAVGAADVEVAAAGKYDGPQPAHGQGGSPPQMQDEHVGACLPECRYPKPLLLRRLPGPCPRNR